jgi:beta-mannosidase
LSGPWSATSPSQSLSITGSVPGDLITDLFHAGVIPEPLYELNWLNASIWNDHAWYYNRTFSLSRAQVQDLTDPSNDSDILLVFDGIKMGANLYLNDVLIGQALAQFERLIFSFRSIVNNSTLKGAIKAGGNVLSVVFDHTLSTPLFMQCTGGWDWAPYSNTTTHDGKEATFSRGIWKNVYLLNSPRGLVITDIVPLITYNGPFPTTPLSDGAHAGFTVNLTVHVWATAPDTGSTLVITPSWVAPAITQRVRIPSGVSAVRVLFRVSAADVLLWWPQGLGAQPLYQLNVRLESGDRGTIEGTRRVGFRFFAIVTGNDTDPSYVEANRDADGTDDQGMRFRINGAPIFVKGANVIPMDNNEGRYTAAAHRRMVLSAADGGMNILRIWGGGVFLPSIFYATADEAGVLVYHDMMNRDYFSGMQQEVNAYQNTIRRLATHPSIAIWDGCNECDATQGEIGTTVMTIVTSEDSSRPVWPSCPAAGWISGVNRLSSIPNGKAMKPKNPRMMATTKIGMSFGAIETHGPYQHGDGWPAVNGDNSHLNLFDPMLPLPLNPSTRSSLGLSNVFTSEFGSVGWSSWESVSPTIAPTHWALHGGAPKANCTGGFSSQCTPTNVMAQRNYPCDSILITYFGGQQTDLDQVGEQHFKKQLFQCLYGQALVLKTYIEQHRSTNTYGLQIWQLNEIWPTGGWGTIEYGTVEVAGQVEGGRWKPAHHWLRDHLYTDRIITCGQDTTSKNASSLLCLLKNDFYQAVSGDIVIEAIDLIGKATSTLYTAKGVTLAGGPGVSHWFTIPAVNPATTILRASYLDPVASISIARNTILLTTPGKLQLSPVTLSVSFSAEANLDGTLDLTLRKEAGSAPAVFVTLTTLAQGRFSENAFVMDGEVVTVQFIPFGALEAAVLRRSLRVETANQYA